MKNVHWKKKGQIISIVSYENSVKKIALAYTVRVSLTWLRQNQDNDWAKSHKIGEN